MNKKILLIAGREGNFFFAEALQRVFKTDVDIVTYMQCAEKEYYASWKNKFKNHFSFVDFYKNRIHALKEMDNAKLDELQTSLERKHSVRTSAMFTYYDPHFRNEPCYRDLRHRQLAYLEFLDKLLTGDEYGFVLSGVSTYFMNCLQEACLAKRIPYVTTINARYLTIAVIDKKGQQVGMRSTFERLMRGEEDAVPSAVRQHADAWFDNFVSAPKRPPYAIMNSRVRLSVVSMGRKLLRQLSPSVLREYREFDLDREFHLIKSPFWYLYNGILCRLRALQQNRSGVFAESPDLSEKFFYLPLHLTPEIVDLVYGTNYDHHEGFVVQLAKRIPSTVQLYVKDHTSMLGRRKTSFYERINSLYNAQCIHPRVSTFNLIKNSQAVITVTGTAGWEAFLLGKPVVTFGNVFYNFLPGVLGIDMYDEAFPHKVERYLAEFEPSEIVRRNAVRAYFGSTFSGTMGDIGIDTKRSDALSNAESFAVNLRSHLNKWRGEIQGDLPADL